MIISGAGGQSTSQAKPKIPQTDKDKLSNTSYLQLLDLWGEGEIEGFASAAVSGYARDTAQYNLACLKDIYFDKTPILSASADVSTTPSDDSFNFKNVETEFRWGTQSQAIVSSLPAVESEVQVGVIVTYDGGGITRRITDTDTNAVRVTLNWAQLQWFQDDGDTIGTTVQWNIEISYNGGGFTPVLVSEIRDKRSPDPFTLDQIVPISGAFPVDVRVRRTRPDETDPKIINEFSWASYTIIKNVRMRYPNSAYCYIRVSAEDFSSIPTRSYKLRLLKVKIPSNGTVDQVTGRITYSGIWDGTFSAAQWTSDPAWCLWDLLTSERYGLGSHIPAATLDKWSFYSASQYCSELVPTGTGSATEPRFSCNVSIQNLTEAYKLINDLCSVMRCMPYWSAGGITIAQDRPSDPVYLFNQSTIEGDFQYSGTSLTQRHTVASVGWLDLDNQDLAYEYVEDAKAIDRYGVIVAEVTGFACTTRTQAARVGRMLLATEQSETEIVTFNTALDAGVQVRPGMIVSISDPKKIGGRQGGRIKSGTTTTVGIDVGVGSLPSAPNPTIHAALVDGTVQSRPVVGLSGTTVTVSPAFSAAPLVGGAYIYAESVTQWRVLGVKEEDRSRYQITALFYNSQKYAFVDRGVPLGTDGFPVVNQALLQVDPLVINAVLPDVSLQVGEALVLTVDPLVISASLVNVDLINPEIVRLAVDPLVISADLVNVDLIDPSIRLAVDPLVATVAFPDVVTIDPTMTLPVDPLVITATPVNVLTVAS